MWTLSSLWKDMSPLERSFCESCRVSFRPGKIRLQLDFSMCAACNAKQPPYDAAESNTLFHINEPSEDLNKMEDPFRTYIHYICDPGARKWADRHCDLCWVEIEGEDLYCFNYHLCEDCFYGNQGQEVKRWTNSFVESTGARYPCDGCHKGCYNSPCFYPNFFACEQCVSSSPELLGNFTKSFPCTLLRKKLGDPHTKFIPVDGKSAKSKMMKSIKRCHVCYRSWSKNNRLNRLDYVLCKNCVSVPNATISAHFRGLFRRTARPGTPKPKIEHMFKKGNQDNPIGSGGYGQVFIVKSTSSSRRFAQKVIRNVQENTRLHEVSLQEANLLLEIKHANIVEGIEKSYEGHTVQIVMELATTDVHSLRSSASGENKTLPKDSVWKIIGDVTAGLYYLHRLDMVHRDVKPENILVFGTDKGATYKLGDLGIARQLSTPKGVVTNQGTDHYKAPEMIQGGMRSKAAGKHSDMWAVGCVLYELLFGTSPFWGESETEVSAFNKMKRESYHIPDGADPGLVKIVRGLLRFQPETRYTTTQVLELCDMERHGVYRDDFVATAAYIDSLWSYAPMPC